MHSDDSTRCQSSPSASGPSTLSMAIGKQSILGEWNGLPSTAQEWTLDDQGELPEMQRVTGGAKHSKKHEVVEELFSRKKVKTAKQFNTTIQKVLSDEHRTTVGMATTLCAVLRYVCERCQDDKKFWPRDGLAAIVQTRLVAASSCTDFISCVIERNDVSLLVTCLQHMQDFPDSSLAQIIEFVLRDLSLDGGEPAQNASSKTVPPSVHCPISPDTAELIDLVLSHPMNDIFMLECITKFEFQKVMILLRYLHYLLNAIKIGDDRDQERLPANVVIDWVMLILDAHYSQLVLSAEARTLLLHLHQIVGTLSHYYDEVDTVHNMLKEIKSSSVATATSTSTANSDTTYSIEVLKL